MLNSFTKLINNSLFCVLEFNKLFLFKRIMKFNKNRNYFPGLILTSSTRYIGQELNVQKQMLLLRYGTIKGCNNRLLPFVMCLWFVDANEYFIGATSGCSAFDDDRYP